MSAPSRIATCLWFDREAEEAARYYCGLFPNSRITSLSRYVAGMPMPEGTPLLVEFVLDGTPFQALNAGPHFRFTEACSLSVICDTQAEIDRLWERLIGDGGSPSQCGWLKDRYGLSWQILTAPAATALRSGGAAAIGRVMHALMPMTKPDIATLERALAG